MAAGPPTRNLGGVAEAQLPDDGNISPPASKPRQSLPPPQETVDVVGGVRRERRRFPIFGYHSFVRLWAAQAISSLGDWIGLFAVLALAARIGGAAPGGGVGAGGGCPTDPGGVPCSL